MYIRENQQFFYYLQGNMKKSQFCNNLALVKPRIILTLYL